MAITRKTQRYLESLFVEFKRTNGMSLPKYTLAPVDTSEGVPSLHRLYLEMEDTTEYAFALAHLGAWDYWQGLLELQWFQPYARKWRQELDLRLQVKALGHIKATAEDPKSKNQLAANRYLLQKAWVKEDGRTVGRPTKAAIRQQAAKLVDAQTEIDEDAKRILN